jgi:hypothetical protein
MKETMMQNKILTEGLKENDLTELVIPMLSIDEFESKVDDDAIVIGFYVKDSDPADDLNRFIQKSPVVLLDTDVSPAPNEDGYFMVFVEIDRNDEFKEKLFTILDEISNLVDIDENDWCFTCYGHDGIFDLTEENVYVLIRTESIETLKIKAFKDNMVEFFQQSILDDMIVEDGNICLTRGSTSLRGSIVAYGSVDVINEAIEINAVNLTEEANRSCRQWELLLGEGWTVHQVGELKVLTSVFDSNVLVIQTT